MLDPFDIRGDFAFEELRRRPRNRAMLFVEILRREYLRRRPLLDQERSALHHRRYCSHSNTPAAPCPPPTHIVTIPYFAPLRGISRRIVAVSFAPVHPSGWPSAIAPP